MGDILEELYNIFDDLNIIPRDLITMVIEYLPVSFPEYRQYLCLNNLNIITGDGRRDDIIDGMMKIYRTHGYKPFVFTNRAERYPSLKRTRILTFGRFSLDRFINILDQNSIVSKHLRKRYILFIDDPSPEFLSYFTLSNMIFHGGNLLLPIYISLSRWKELPVTLKVMADSWITRERYLRGKNKRSEKEVELLFNRNQYFLVHELKSYDLDSDLFWIDVDNIPSIFDNLERV